MAVNAATIWEFRATNGSNTNGGGYYNADPGTSVDYSNQNAAEESYTTLATSGAAATTVTCGGADTFDAGIAGNVIYIASGTNFVAGWYQVTVRNSATSVDVDRSPTPAGAGSDGVGNMGGALALFTDAFLDDTNLVVAGNTLWVKNDGTMTLTGNIQIANDGTIANYIKIEGYNSSRGDNPTGTNRPLIAAADYIFEFDDYWSFKNLRITITSAQGFDIDAGCTVYNVAVNNSSETAGRYALYNGGSWARVIGCDLQSANGYALVPNAHCRIIGCYIHDSDTGIFNSLGDTTAVIGCVIDSCSSYGIRLFTAIDYHIFMNNTIYNCGIGIEGADTTLTTIINNIIDNCTTGLAYDAAGDSRFIDYNCWDNTADVDNATKGDNAVTGDPGMTDPANGDFSIPNNSNCVDAALDAGDYTDATV